MPLSDKKIQNLKNELVNFIRARQFKKAEKLYTRFRNKNIHDVEIWRYFAGVHSERGNPDEMIDCCRKILEITPEDSTATYNLGACLQNQNRPDLAIEKYEKCIDLDPNHINAITNCAKLHFSTGDVNKAAMYFRKSLEKNDTPETRLQYGEALMRSGDKENALVQFNYLCSTSPNNKKPLFLAAQCYYELRKYSDSAKKYLQLLETDKTNINVINNLGRVYEEAGQLEKAIEFFQQAVSINNSKAIIQINLGKALLKTGNLAGAKNAFDNAVNIEPENPEIHFNIGKIHNESGDSINAKKCFSEALNMDIKKYLEKPDEFVLAVKYFLSNLENPETFNEDKKAFVADLFDGYAEKFDTHLVKSLQYKTPQIINDLLSSHVANKNGNTLDLGCGTGLCCEHLKSFSNKITGIDLSPKMVDKAHEINCYDNLFVGEITEVVNQLNEPFDLVVAADVFVYIGSLEDIFEACNKKMHLNSYLIFSTEYLPESLEGDFKLLDSGRYKHSTKYLDQLKKKHEFTLIEHFFCVLRKENGKDVKGCITVLKKEN